MNLMELLWDPKYNDQTLIVIDVVDCSSGDVLRSVSGSWQDEDVNCCLENTVSVFSYVRDEDVLYAVVLNDN